jgi:hypothetical protein
MAVSAATDFGRRRYLYAFNAGVQVALVAAIVAGAVFLGQRYRGEVDLTRTGVNSLSPRTQKLLAGLPEPVKITGIYGVVIVDDRVAEKRRDMVRDLLSLYQRANPRMVTTAMVDPVKEPARIGALLKELRELSRYQNESEPHTALLKQIPDLNARIASAASADAARMRELPSAGARSKLPLVAESLSVIAEKTRRIDESVRRLERAELPRYGELIDAIRNVLTETREFLQRAAEWMRGEGRKLAAESGEAVAFFDEAAGRYDALVAEIDKTLEGSKDLKPIALEEIATKLQNAQDYPAIIVEDGGEARVVSFDEVWKFRAEGRGRRSRDEDDRDFAGEEAISSAILKLTQKEKTAIVFTRFGGQPLITPTFMPDLSSGGGAFEQFGELLRDENFVVQEWDVSAQKTPPAIPDAKRTVYVVFPPEPPRPNPMIPAPRGSITEEDRKIITDAVDASGMAVFLTGWLPAFAPYEFESYLRNQWGVHPRSEMLTCQFAALPDRAGLYYPMNTTENGVMLLSQALRFTDHPIAKPEQAQLGAFLNVCPIDVVPEAERPEGTKIAPVVEVEKTDLVWALPDPEQRFREASAARGFARREADKYAPFPIAVTAESPDQKRIAVFGSVDFGADRLAQYKVAAYVGAALVDILMFPANRDLMLNTLYWVSNDADRISVGPKGSDLPRLDKLKEGPGARFWRVFLVAIWPAAMLCVGAGVWLLRRR